MAFVDFEHKLLKSLKEQFDFKNKTITVACSGGADSVALFVALSKIKPVLGCKLQLLHVHHGECEDPNLLKYRDQAVNFCKELALKFDADFAFAKSDTGLLSEQDCRDFRKSHYNTHECIFTGHHKGDLLETYLLRLIRGTGLQGLQKPFSEQAYRPFLDLFGKAEILSYLKERQEVFLEDPSNESADYLRNWVRENWIKKLEKDHSIKGLETSFKVISDEVKALDRSYLNEITIHHQNKEGSFESSLWLGLDQFQKQSIVAHVLYKTVRVGYTRGHVDEVVKNLNRSRKHQSFSCGGLLWTKDESRVMFKNIFG